MKRTKHLFSAALLAFALTACSSQTAGSASQGGNTDSLFKAGTYEGEEPGFGGDGSPIHVTVTLSDDAIDSIEYKADGETPTVGGAALPQLVENVISAQSTNIDGVSGATVTSTGFFAAVNEALQAAGTDPKTLTPKETDSAPAENIERQ